MEQTLTRPLLGRADRGEVACLIIDNPPVNAIGVAVRAALDAALDAAETDRGVAGLVIGAAGPLFSGGGDMREIGRSIVPGGPSMTELAARIEAFPKPVAVAIQGRAIGGAVLMALACHARLGTADATVALPEVRLGFVPGTGGTQRLPRLVGQERALEMAALARTLDAAAALSAGFLDGLVEAAALLDVAAERVRAIAEGALPWRRTTQLPVPDAAAEAPALAARFAALAQEAFPDRQAPRDAIALILAAATTPFAEGLRREKAAFDRLANSAETRALVEAFLTRAGRRG